MPTAKETIQPQSGEVIKDVSARNAERAPLPKNVESWIERLEKDPQMQQVADDQGQPLLTPAQKGDDDQVKITINKGALSSGFAKTVGEAGRWLAEFWFRLIKIKKGKVKFEDE